MKVIEINGHKIKMYASAEELPISLYNKFQKYMMVDMGVGSDMEAVGKHLGKIFEFSQHKLNDAIYSELKNLYYNYHLILEGTTLSALAFLCLVHSIDEEKILDYSEENLKVLIDQLDKVKISVEKIKEEVFSAKKK